MTNHNYTNDPAEQESMGPFQENITIGEGRGIWLSLEDICEYLNVSTYVVVKLINSKQLPAIKIGREWRIAQEDISAWVNKLRQENWNKSRKATG